jgi:DNA-binding SARP family transcriptional activator
VIRRWIDRVWLAGWLLALLVGLPAVLIAGVGWPLPDRWPGRAAWQHWLAQPLTRAGVIDALAVAGWLLWAVLVYALLVEAMHRLGRVVRLVARLQLPPLPTPLQATASGVLGAAVFSLTTSSPATSSPTAGSLTGAAVPASGQASVVDPASTAEPASTGAGAAPGGHRSQRPPSTLPAVTVAGPGPGVQLPDGGWIPHDAAAAVSAAATLVWLRRRIGYVPRPPGRRRSDDPGLTPLPDTVAAVRAALLPDPDQETGQPDAVAAAGTGISASGVAAGGVSIGADPGGALRPTDLPAGGVGLVGPGALDAARGVLTAVLLAGVPHRPGDDPRVVTTTGVLHHLFGPAATRLADIPGLRVVEGLNDALAVLEQAALHRSHTNPTVPTIGQPAAGGPDPLIAGLVAPMLLLTGVPPSVDAARRVGFTFTLAAGVGITGVLLGAWVHGPTWRVDTDGTTAPTEPAPGWAGTAPAKPADAGGAGPRLCVLSAAASSDLLTLAAEALHGGPVDPAGPHDPLPASAVEQDAVDGGGGNRPPPDRPAPHPVGQRQPSPGHPARSGDGAGSGEAIPAQVEDMPTHTAAASAAPVRLRLRVLGPVTVHGGAGVAEVGRSAARQILVFLAVHPGGASSTQLAAAVWPGTRPSPVHRVYHTINYLREVLPGGQRILLLAGGRYHLDPTRVEVDLWRLHTTLDQATTAADPAAARQALHAALHAYTGELAAGQPWPWVEIHRETIRRQALDAAVGLLDTEPDPAVAAALLHTARRIDPYNHHLHHYSLHRAAAAHPPPGPDQSPRPPEH